MRTLTILLCFFLVAAARVPDLNAVADYVFDGDTFSATVHLENGAEVSAHVRIMDIDAPEMHGKCESEIAWAIRSKNRLAELLPKGTKIKLSKIKDDKYLKRIDAFVTLPDGRDVSKIMLAENLAVKYDGGKRQSWCNDKGE